MLTGGGSTTKMFKLAVNNQYYVLRLMGLDQPLEDRLIQVEGAQYGGRLNIAPTCHYVDVEQGIIIMDYINHTPLTKEVILQKMPKLLSKLHYSEKISKPFCVIFPYMNNLINDIIKITPSKPLVNYLNSIEEVIVILNNHRQLASCHNDLNSENILYDVSFKNDIRGETRENTY
ncbi:hypothetical protein BH10PSE19_BH10PSE19_23340 [soil metagenome]